MNRFTERTAEGIAYLVGVTDDEQEAKKCIREALARFAELEDMLEPANVIIPERMQDTKIFVPEADEWIFQAICPKCDSVVRSDCEVCCSSCGQRLDWAACK
jgi:hypothetical protein